MINHTISPDEIKELENKFECVEHHPKYQLWSINEIVERFSAAQLINSISFLTDLFHRVQNEQADKGTFNKDVTSSDFNSLVVEGLKYIRLSRLLKLQIERVSKNLARQDCDYHEAIFILRELKDNIVAELTTSRFLQIPEDRIAFYENKNPLFGDNVETFFHSANSDITSAGRCFALDEWTACVFHLMRVLEFGLRELAKLVGLPENEINIDEWRRLIDKTDKKIETLQNISKSSERDKELQFFSEAANTFRYYKDAYRNYLMHGHQNYSENDAITIYSNVRAFMQTLANHLVS